MNMDVNRNNDVYGKIMENLRKRIDVKLANNKKTI